MNDTVISEAEKAELEIEKIWKTYQSSPTLEIRNFLVENYMPLVRYNAERVWSKLPNEVELDDLVSCGIIGLMDSIESFDLGRGVKFATYCSRRIRGAILDELRERDWVPRIVRNRMRKVEEARKNLETQFGRDPNDDELAKEMGLDKEEFERVVGDTNHSIFISLSRPRNENDGHKDLREIDVLEDKRSRDPVIDMHKKDIKELIMRGLSRAERLIVLLYYYEEMTMKEIGSTLDLSESRVSQMHSAIIKRLRQHLQNRSKEFEEETLEIENDLGLIADQIEA
jgi:RNA polymerase sigma factor for flagellar operon FliA